MNDQVSLEQIGRDLWANKPLLIAVVAAVVVVIFILIRNSQNNLAASTATAPASTSTLPTGGGGTYVEDSHNVYAPVTTSTTTMGSTTLPTLPVPVTTVVGHGPGSTFLGPSGVKHYVATGAQTLSQIAAHFGLQSWNSIYAIPDNQKALGKMNATSARGYTPAAGTVLSLPGSTSIGF